MRKRQILAGLLLMLATVGLLAGCGGAAATETVSPDEVPVVTSGADDKVVAEAVIEPDRWSELRFDAAGDVVEVLVQESDVVSESDVLARLETTDLERAVAQAELSLHQAQLSLSQAQLRLEQLQEPRVSRNVRSSAIATIAAT